MKLGLAHRLLIALSASACWAGAAFPQSAACERFRAELASLDRAGARGRSVEAAVQRQYSQIMRLTGYYRSIGCEQGAFFWFQPRAECGPIAQRIRALQASYGVVTAQIDPEAIDTRRRHLRVAISRSCDAAPESHEAYGAKGGDRTVCVRTCDGYFFPLEAKPQGSATTASLCRALCPNADVAVYKASVNGGIETAVSETGKPYMHLANALRYQKAYDSSCSCKKEGETWAQALRTAEGMIASNKRDIIVTQAVADRLARAALARVTSHKAFPESPASGSPSNPADVETTGSVTEEGADEGESPEGPKPRIIAPDLFPVPSRLTP